MTLQEFYCHLCIYTEGAGSGGTASFALKYDNVVLLSSEPDGGILRDVLGPGKILRKELSKNYIELTILRPDQIFDDSDQVHAFTSLDNEIYIWNTSTSEFIRLDDLLWFGVPMFDKGKCLVVPT